MGPDYFFFSLKEYGTPLDEFVNFIFEVYDAFEPLITFYEDNIEPVINTIEDAIAAKVEGQEITAEPDLERPDISGCPGPITWTMTRAFTGCSSGRRSMCSTQLPLG